MEFLKNPFLAVPFLIVESLIFWSVAFALKHAYTALGNHAPAAPSGAQSLRHPHLLYAILLAAISVIIIWRSPYSSSEMKVTDSVEYASAAQRLVLEHTYSIEVDGIAHPPRYQPWYSILVLAPCYILGGHELGNAAFGTALFAALGIVAAYFLGAALSNAWGGTVAALLVLSTSTYRYFSTEPLSDVPCSTLLAIAVLILLIERRDSQRLSPVAALAAGILGGTAAAFRPTAAVFFIPYTIHIAMRLALPRSFIALTSLLAPLFFVILANISYNLMTFGDPLRTGYHYWTAVPYDYPKLLFGTQYLAENLRTLWESNSIVQPIGACAILCIILYQMARGAGNKDVSINLQNLRTLTWIASLLIPPFLAFYLLYFYPTWRFYLPLLLILYSVLGGLLGALIPNTRTARHTLVVLLPTLVAVTVCYRVLAPDKLPASRLTADHLAAVVPDNALIISSMNPVYLERMVLKGTNRRVMPVSRSVEYASKLITRRKVVNPNPTPTSALDHRSRGLLAGGAREAVNFVALDNSEKVIEAIDLGIPVYAETRFMEAADLKELGKRFHLEAIDRHLFEVWKRK